MLGYTYCGSALVVPQMHLKDVGALERFSNWYSLTHFIEGDFFLRKKPLSLLASVYSYWRTALAIDLALKSSTVPHPFAFFLAKGWETITGSALTSNL